MCQYHQTKNARHRTKTNISCSTSGVHIFFEFIILRPPDNMPASFRNPYDLSTPSDRKFSICKQLEKGTIVKSETKRVDENDGAAGRDMLLIGLCGVGLYSANAVSDNIRSVNAHNHL